MGQEFLRIKTLNFSLLLFLFSEEIHKNKQGCASRILPALIHPFSSAILVRASFDKFMEGTKCFLENGCFSIGFISIAIISCSINAGVTNRTMYVLVESVKVNFWITLETDVFGLVSCTNHKDGC